jgi:hypothetical protein
MRVRAPYALLALTLGTGLLPAPAAAQVAETVGYAGAASPDAINVATWVTASGDNFGRPFIIIDKIGALVLVFDGQGQFLGETPALLGTAHGDESVPGIGDRELSAISPEQRTTPAGRFLATFGRALGQRKVLWVDYASSVALHPVVKGNKKDRRLERLQSPAAEDNRITYGCINISAAFFNKTVVAALEKSAGGVVYTLPETKPLNEVFPTFRAPEGVTPPLYAGR